jgi:hypothetical protein
MYYAITLNDTSSSAANKLQALRDALNDCAGFYAWIAGVQQSELETLGLAQADAQALQTAFADANALADFYSTGLPPSSYPQPASSYVYGASQRQIIGPR